MGFKNLQRIIQMNDFTKEELIEILGLGFSAGTDFRMVYGKKLQSMIDNYCEHENIQTIGTGQLLFNNKDSGLTIISKIGKQIALCENENELKCFRIDWQIFYGPKTR